jgi:hypothetical protein
MNDLSPVIYNWCATRSSPFEPEYGIRLLKEKGLEMAKKADIPLVQISSWAVGRFADGSQVAFRINDITGVMSVADARAIAAALNSEVEELGRMKHQRRAKSATS